MNITLLFLVAVAAIVLLVLISWLGFRAALMTGVLVALAFAPRQVVALGELTGTHSGLTTAVVLISTYTVAIAIATVYLIGQRQFRVPLPLVFFVVLTGVLLQPAWGGTAAQISGWVHLTVAALAWGVGYGLSKGGLDLDGPTSTRWAQAITWVLIGQVVVTGVTMAGVALPSFITLTDNVGERAVGTLGNAANLSKITFLLLILLLPLTSSAVKATRRWAGVGVALSLIVTGLTVSRANMVAVAALVAVWSLLTPGRVSVRVRVLMIILGAAAVYFFAGPFIERMDHDPAGTLRPSLTAAALVQIESSPWIGVGPNNYVETVGQWDSVTAAGYPVHNAFLLMIAEVGIPLAILFFLPFITLAWRALRNRKTAGTSGAFSWAILGAVPGILVITLTGWGMLSGFSLCLWMLVSGVALAQIEKEPKDEDRVLLSAAARRERMQASLR